ncbi:Mannan endo-1,4-beta-mannosidase [Reticulomyxa filosa]|uniref:mannan endo-1,4-beta-mannosidase n=1 Tax=Reticulomyxa filosa TaxID=46433 RepID=X6PEY2_RETFI|nr:Mannan endo-1,4-beta-mannosidase [Reticulomyxa filosa]|eukprot:ETO36237.1 Mannan endo-1,4-beta-mannosidase [Reticulomyxa filosa]
MKSFFFCFLAYFLGSLTCISFGFEKSSELQTCPPQSALVVSKQTLYENKEHSLGIQNYTTAELLEKYPNSFITRNGSQLMIEGSPIRLAGGNIYWLGLDENGSPGIAYPTEFRQRDAITTAVKVLGATCWEQQIVRTRAERFNEEAAAIIDRAIAIAKENNVRLVIPLTDNWHYYHGGEYTFCNWRGTNNLTEFYSNETIVKDFENYIWHLLNHYNNLTGNYLKDEPTILAWETGNEICPPPQWTNDICLFIKSINSGKQLVLSGRYGVSSLELELECVDLYSNHYYPMDPQQVAMDAQLSFVNIFFKKSNAITVVFFAGEFGWTTGDLSFLDSFLESMYSNGVNMDCYWSLFPHNDSYGFEYHDDGFSLYYPGEYTPDDLQTNTSLKIKSLRNHALLMSGYTPGTLPDYPVCGQPKISNITSDISNGATTIFWRGACGCCTYNIEKSFQNDAGWVVLTSGVTDFEGFFQDDSVYHECNLKIFWFLVSFSNIENLAFKHKIVDNRITIKKLEIDFTYSYNITLKHEIRSNKKYLISNNEKTKQHKQIHDLSYVIDKISNIFCFLIVIYTFYV